MLVKACVYDPVMIEFSSVDSVKSYDKHSFFIYQKPSTSWSFEFQGEGINKFWREETVIIDPTSAQYKMF